MTASVNLLPARYVERIAERRRAGIAAAALVVLVGVLTLAASSQSHELRRAEKERDLERARNAELQARRVKLLPFRQLADAIVGRERVLASAMGPQVAWAGVLSGLSRAFPADASLTSLTAESTLAAFGAVPPAGSPIAVIGSTTLKGYSVERFTPGVQGVLQLLGTVNGLSEPRLQAGEVSTIGGGRVTTFEGSTFVNAAALTRRYAKGLPPESHIDVPLAGRAPSAAPAAPAVGASK